MPSLNHEDITLSQFRPDPRTAAVTIVLIIVAASFLFVQQLIDKQAGGDDSDRSGKRLTATDAAPMPVENLMGRLFVINPKPAPAAKEKTEVADAAAVTDAVPLNAPAAVIDIPVSDVTRPVDPGAAPPPPEAAAPPPPAPPAPSLPSNLPPF